METPALNYRKAFTIGLEYSSNKKLAKAQRKLSRMQGSLKGENKSIINRKQQQIHKHISNQRLGKLHKISTETANRYDVLCVETLNMRAVSNKGFGNGKATLDNVYGLFLNMLAYKMADRGNYLTKVDKWFSSSQICNCCGRIQKLKLSDRIYKSSSG